MLRVLSLLFALIATSCTSSRMTLAPGMTPSTPPQIEYVSSDLGNAAVFAASEARFGPPFLALGPEWPSSPVRYFEEGNGVQCVSVGPPASSDEFAIKRPIRLGERYSCLTTSFRVIRCFERCRAAVIERTSGLVGSISGASRSYIYVHDCIGVLAFSQRDISTSGIPLDAALLRSAVGILSNNSYPNCRHY